jgi:hypothetical protein
MRDPYVMALRDFSDPSAFLDLLENAHAPDFSPASLTWPPSP